MNDAPSASMSCNVTSAEDGAVLITLITESHVVEEILACLGLPTEPPTVHPARGSPELF